MYCLHFQGRRVTKLHGVTSQMTVIILYALFIPACMLHAPPTLPFIEISITIFYEEYKFLCLCIFFSQPVISPDVGPDTFSILFWKVCNAYSSLLVCVSLGVVLHLWGWVGGCQPLTIRNVTCYEMSQRASDSSYLVMYVSFQEHPRNLIPELCRLFYNLGWVTGTGGGISIKHE
jgi:hypothetical protein